MASSQPLSPLRYRRWLHWFAIALVIVTFVLVIAGGTVTSKGAALAVPDWPTSYSYNMFLFPPSMWVGNIFWEHTHRLLGSLVGMLSIAMAICLWCTQRQRPFVRWNGILLLVLVVIQGVMGGLRVTQLSMVLAVAHGITAQLFLCMTVFIAAATSQYWSGDSGLYCASCGYNLTALTSPTCPECGARIGNTDRSVEGLRLAATTRILSLVLLAVLLIQLTLGALMRHSSAGLAIPDFPTSYGRIIPPFTQTAIVEASDKMIELDEVAGYFTPAQVGVHFAHRVWAIVVLIAAGMLVTRLTPSGHAEAGDFWGQAGFLVRPAGALVLLLIVQVALGAMVIWTGRHTEIATTHQAVGAATLATAVLLAIRVHRFNPDHAAPTPTEAKNRTTRHATRSCVRA